MFRVCAFLSYTLIPTDPQIARKLNKVNSDKEPTIRVYDTEKTARQF